MKRCDLDILSCGSCTHPEITTRNRASLKPAEFPSMVGIIRHPQEGIILFDTGYDHAFFEATTMFPEQLYRWTTPVTLLEGQSAIDQLARMGIAAADVRIIIISHFHADHISGLHHFKNAKIFCAKAGLHPCLNHNRFKLTTRGILPALIPSDILARATFFEDGRVSALPSCFEPFTAGIDILGDSSLMMVELPGHCPGHWGMICKTAQDQFVFLVADAAWSITAIEDNTPPPKVTTFFLGNTSATRKTLYDLHKLIIKKQENIILLPSHCKTSLKVYTERA